MPEHAPDRPPGWLDGRGGTGHSAGNRGQGAAPMIGQIPDRSEPSRATLEERLTSAEADATRMSRELAEALEQQTAMAEVLRAIASAPTNLTGVLDAITEAAGRLSDSPSAHLQRLDEETGSLYMEAAYGPNRAMIEQRRREGKAVRLGLEGQVPTRDFVSGRAFLERRTIRIA